MSIKIKTSEFADQAIIVNDRAVGMVTFNHGDFKFSAKFNVTQGHCSGDSVESAIAHAIVTLRFRVEEATVLLANLEKSTRGKGKDHKAIAASLKRILRKG